MKSAVVVNLIFDPIKTLTLIEGDSDLKAIFQDDVATEIPLLKTMSQQGSLPTKIEGLLEDIFNQIILFKKQYSDAYAAITDTPSSHKKRKVLPRRYGKVQILEDIKNSGGKANDLQRAMLSVNELKNLYVAVTNRCITDYFNEKRRLTDAECREITGAVENMQKKFRTILKKK